MRCAECENNEELVEETRDLSYTYKGKKTVLKDISGGFCPACGEVYFRQGQGDKYMAAIRAFKKEVNAALFDAEFVLKTRKKLGLDQREAGELFGGGVNGFSRYETGKIAPPVALVKLLRLLDKHPDLLEELRGNGRLEQDLAA